MRWTTGVDAKVLWFSPVIERKFLWDGEVQLPRDLSNDERRPQTAAQRKVEAFELAHAARRKVDHLGLSHPDPIKPTPDGGYAMLATVDARRRVERSVAGRYYLEVDKDGQIAREVHLEPLARRLGATSFSDFLPVAEGGILVAGSRDPTGNYAHVLHVSRVDRTGNPEWTLRPELTQANVVGIAGTDSNVWVFGQGRDEGSQRAIRNVAHGMCLRRSGVGSIGPSTYKLKGLSPSR